MTGRGRGATLPAWMTAGDPKLGIPPIDNSASQPSKDNSYVDNYKPQYNAGVNNNNSVDVSRDRGGIRDKDRNDRDDRDRRQQRRSKSRSRDRKRDSRDRGGDRSGSRRNRSNSNDRGGWKSRKEKTSINSNFDQKPPSGTNAPMPPSFGVPPSSSSHHAFVPPLPPQPYIPPPNMGGPDSLTVTGIPINLSDAEVKELVEAFGPVKFFDRVKDIYSNSSSATVEYCERASADIAVSGLHGLALAGRNLSVRKTAAPPLPPTPSAPMPIPVPAPKPALFANLPATKVLKLSNMVTHEELDIDSEYEDIKEDIRIECSQFGNVLKVFIPRVKDGYPSNIVGLIFVDFANSKEAKKAGVALNGRKFADKFIIVEYFDEIKFSNQVYV